LNFIKIGKMIIQFTSRKLSARRRNGHGRKEEKPVQLRQLFGHGRRLASGEGKTSRAKEKESKNTSVAQSGCQRNPLLPEGGKTPPGNRKRRFNVRAPFSPERAI